MHRLAAAVTVALALLTSEASAGQRPRPFVFGINASAQRADFEVARAAGCTCVRIGCGWDLVEPEEGRFDWAEPDQAVRLCREFGFEPFFLIVATPKWALSPEKRDKPWGWAAEPQFHPLARRFYKTLAARYRGKVRYYEFWNEPNGYGWHEPNHPEEYAPILKLAYRALKEGDPGCVVAVGGLDGSGWKGYYRYLEKLYELGCGSSFDAVAVHPYRKDGPIDLYGLRKIRRVLLEHGHGERKLWITEYGWSNERGHDNKARWLAASLDILTSPEFDYVFQASVHTLDDFDDAEYGLCTRDLRPRAAYQVFRDYPKDWAAIRKLHAAAPPPNLCDFPGDGFESGSLRWTRYGDGLRLRRAEDVGLRAESGQWVLAAQANGSPRNGGAWRTVETAPGVPIRIQARVFTNERCGNPRNSRCRVGIDPTGRTDPAAASVIWSRWVDTAGEWDTAGVGQGDPIMPNEVSGSGACAASSLSSDRDRETPVRITVFLDYAQDGASCDQVNAFDEVSVTAREDTFRLPEVEPVVTPDKTYEPVP